MTFRKTPIPLSGIFTMLVLCLTLITAQGFAQTSTSEDIAILDRASKAFVNVVKQAKPAVVHIKVEKTTTSSYQGGQIPEDLFNHPFFEQFFGPQFRQRQPEPR